MPVMHKFKELYQGAKNVIYRATCVMIVSWEQFFSDELRSELLKMPDLTRQATHNHCRTSSSTSLAHQTLLVPNVHFTLLENSRFKKGQLLASCKCCGNKHQFTQSSRCPAFPWKKMQQGTTGAQRLKC